MIDERDLREMLERRVRTISATPADTPKAVRRARGRLALNAAVGTLVGLAVLAGAFAGVRTIQAGPIPANPPTPSPVPARGMGSLAYELDGDIYVADWDGSNSVRIADGRAPGDCGGRGEYLGDGPIWSPDGRYLAYRRTDCDAARDAWWDVVISDVDGNVVTTFPFEGWLISWSPDSTRVAAWVRWGETIGVYGLDGVRQTVLTVPPGMMAPGDHDPVWSRDGASLLVPRGVEVPLDGSTPKQLPSDDPRTFDATHSPDGSPVAYTVTQAALVVASADGSGARELVQGPVWDPVWSPAGDRIVFVYLTSETDDGYTAATELQMVDIASGIVTRLAGMDGTAILGSPQFSPDGDRILFSRAEADGGVSLWTVRADGSDARRLVAGSGWGEWQPSGDMR